MSQTPVKLNHKDLEIFVDELDWVFQCFSMIFQHCENLGIIIPQNKEIDRLMYHYADILNVIRDEFVKQGFNEFDTFYSWNDIDEHWHLYCIFGVRFDDDCVKIEKDRWNVSYFKKEFNSRFQKYLKDLKIQAWKNRTTGEVIVKYLE